MRIVQVCATLRYASRKYSGHLARDLKSIHTAPTPDAAWAALEKLEEKWGKSYPAIQGLTDSWSRPAGATVEQGRRLELATLSWVHWHNHDRLHGST